MPASPASFSFRNSIFAFLIQPMSLLEQAMTLGAETNCRQQAKSDAPYLAAFRGLQSDSSCDE